MASLARAARSAFAQAGRSLLRSQEGQLSRAGQQQSRSFASGGVVGAWRAPDCRELHVGGAHRPHEWLLAGQCPGAKTPQPAPALQATATMTA